MDKNNFTKGYFLLSRSIFESDIWYSPAWQLKAWIYLLGNANHSPLKRAGQKLSRGQILTTGPKILEAITENRGFTKIKPVGTEGVKAFMSKLKKLEMVETHKTTRGMIISLLNYDKYQSPDNYLKNNVQSIHKTICKTKRAPMIDNNIKNEKLKSVFVSDLKSETINYFDKELYLLLIKKGVWSKIATKISSNKELVEYWKNEIIKIIENPNIHNVGAYLNNAYEHYLEHNYFFEINEG